MSNGEGAHMQEVTGDIAGNLRLTQPIGTLMLALRDCDEVYDEIYETWVHDSQVFALLFQPLTMPPQPFCECLSRHACALLRCAS